MPDLLKYLYWIIFVLLYNESFGHVKHIESLTSSSQTPKLVQSPTNQTISEGQPIQLSCAIDQTTDYFFWYFTPLKDTIFQSTDQTNQGDQLQTVKGAQMLAVCNIQPMCKKSDDILWDLNIHSTGLLQIPNTKPEHSGRYDCSISSGLHIVTAHSYVMIRTVPNPPVIQIYQRNEQLHAMSNYSFTEGEQIRLVCTSRRGFPSPKLTWLTNNLAKNVGLNETLAENHTEYSYLNHDSIHYKSSPMPYEETTSWYDFQLTWIHSSMKIQCRASNKEGLTISKPIYISVSFSPRIKAFQFKYWPIIYDQLDHLECDAWSNPSAHIYWIDSWGKILSNSRNLSSTILTQGVFDNNYPYLAQTNWKVNVTCVAENIRGSNQRTITAEIQFAPKIKTPNYMSVKTGQSARLVCEVLSNPAPERVYWIRHSNSKHHPSTSLLTNLTDPGKEHSYWTSPVLQINAVAPGDAGLYTCVAENQLVGSRSRVGRTESSTELKVDYPPGEPTVRLFAPKVWTTGSMVKMQCFLNREKPGHPQPRIRWLWKRRNCAGHMAIDEVKTGHLSRHIHKDDTFQLNYTKLGDDGLYFCELDNGWGMKLSRPIDFSLQELPQISKHPESRLTINLNQNYNPPQFECVVRGRPAPTIIWKHNNVQLETEQHFENKSLPSVLQWPRRHTNHPSVHITTHTKCVQLNSDEFTWETTSHLRWINRVSSGSHELVQIEDEGSYACEAWNSLGHVVSNMALLELKYPPQVLHARHIKQVSSYSFDNSESEKFLSKQIQELQDHLRTLFCMFRAHPKPNKITWFYSNQTNQSCTELDQPGSRCDCVQGQMVGQLIDDSLRSRDSLTLEFRPKLWRGYEIYKFLFRNPTRSTSISWARDIPKTAFVVEFSSLSKNLSHPNGVFMVKVENSEGCDLCAIHLQDASVPEPPRHIHIEPLGWNTLRLNYVPGFDGGHVQTINLNYSKITARNSISSVGDTHDQPKLLLITDVPNLPIPQQCEISGLHPNTRYRFVMYGQNKLGRGPSSPEIQYTTHALEFPQIFTERSQTDKVNLSFMDPQASLNYCIRAELAGTNENSWLAIQNTCIDNTTTLNKIKQGRFSEPKSLDNVTVSHEVQSGQFSERLGSEDRFPAHADDPGSPLVENSNIFENNQIMCSDTSSQLTDQCSNHLNQTAASRITFVQFQLDQNQVYRVLACLINQTDVCSEPTFLRAKSDKSRTNSVTITIGTLIGIIPLVVLILFISGSLIRRNRFLFKKSASNLCSSTKAYDFELKNCHTSRDKVEEPQNLLLEMDSENDIWKTKESCRNMTRQQTDSVQTISMTSSSQTEIESKLGHDLKNQPKDFMEFLEPKSRSNQISLTSLNYSLDNCPILAQHIWINSKSDLLNCSSSNQVQSNLVPLANTNLILTDTFPTSSTTAIRSTTRSATAHLEPNHDHPYHHQEQQQQEQHQTLNNSISTLSTQPSSILLIPATTFASDKSNQPDMTGSESWILQVPLQPAVFHNNSN